MRRFNSTEFVNDKVLSRSLFQSQTESLIYSSIESAQTEFRFTVSLTNTMIHLNQYINGMMTNAELSIYQDDRSLKNYGIYTNKIPKHMFPVLLLSIS